MSAWRRVGVAAAVAAVGAFAYWQYRETRPNIDATQHLERLAACGIVLEEPDFLLVEGAGGHGAAYCARNVIALSAADWERDRRMTLESTVPHEFAHLAYCKVTGQLNHGHPPALGPYDDYLRGVTDECP